MEFDLSKTDRAEGYRLLSGLVVPRPIGWVTSVGEDGVVNASPFSYFNLLGSDPPLIGLGISDGRWGEKDTVRNATASGVFVVNLVDEASAEKMNVTAIEFPPHTSEAAEAGLTLEPGVRVPVPRIADAPASLECRLAQRVDIGNNRVLLGEVLHVRLRDDLWSEAERRPLTEDARMIARMHGGGWYARTSDRFNLDRIRLADWEARKGGGA
jgi:flavin reductase (DIM6/NTAB) family NADH-FMN oxidoreductase RutF